MKSSRKIAENVLARRELCREHQKRARRCAASILLPTPLALFCIGFLVIGHFSSSKLPPPSAYYVWGSSSSDTFDTFSFPENNLGVLSRDTASHQNETAPNSRTIIFDGAEISLSYRDTISAALRPYEVDRYDRLTDSVLFCAEFRAGTDELVKMTRQFRGDLKQPTEHPHLSEEEDYLQLAKEVAKDYSNLTGTEVFVSTAQKHFYEQGTEFCTVDGFFTEPVQPQYTPLSTTNHYSFRFAKTIDGVQTTEFTEITLREDGILLGLERSMPDEMNQFGNMTVSQDLLVSTAEAETERALANSIWKLSSFEVEEIELSLDLDGKPFFIVHTKVSVEDAKGNTREALNILYLKESAPLD